MKRSMIALGLAGLLSLTSCTGPAPDYRFATVVWGLGQLSTEPNRITWTVEIEQGAVTRVEEKDGQSNRTSYQLADVGDFEKALHAALNPPQRPDCMDANGVIVQATDVAAEQYAAELLQCGGQERVVDDLLDAVEQHG